MEELECMGEIDRAIRTLEDVAARDRVAAWIAAKYCSTSMKVSASSSVMAQQVGSFEHSVGGKPSEIPGIAKLSPTGELQLTVRDFKARSANDAAVRLAHVVIWATARLTGDLTVSSKSVVVPFLKKYRCYDGNTRTSLANDKGLVREGDLLSLDFHAEQFAEKIVAEILDASTEGKWKPGSTKRRGMRSRFSLGDS